MHQSMFTCGKLPCFVDFMPIMQVLNLIFFKFYNSTFKFVIMKNWYMLSRKCVRFFISSGSSSISSSRSRSRSSDSDTSQQSASCFPQTLSSPHCQSRHSSQSRSSSPKRPRSRSKCRRSQSRHATRERYVNYIFTVTIILLQVSETSGT